MGYRLPESPQGAWRLANEGARLYAEALPHCLPLAIPAALSALLPRLLARDPAHMDAHFMVSAGNLLAGLGLIALLLWLSGALLHRISEFAADRGSAVASLAAALRRLPALSGALFLASAAFALVMVLLALGLASYPAVAVLAGMLVAFYLSVRLAVLTAEIVLRPSGVLAGIQTSWRLSAGQSWLIVFTVGLIAALFLVAFAVVALGATILSAVAPVLAGWVAAGLALVVIGIFTAPLGAAIIVVLWNDLRLRSGEPAAS